MLDAFKKYLLTLKLSQISRKLYLADVRRFLIWLGAEPTLAQVFSAKSYTRYMENLRKESASPSIPKRTLASLRQFGTFISLTYSVKNPMSNFAGTEKPAQKTMDPSFLNYIKHFTKYLNAQHLSPLTVKSYKSDITRYLDWSAGHLTSTKVTQLLIDQNIKKYLMHLTDSGLALESTIDRKEKSLARFSAWLKKIHPQSSVSDNIVTYKKSAQAVNYPKKRESKATFTSFDEPEIAPEVKIPDLEEKLPIKTSNLVKINNYRKDLSKLWTPNVRNLLTLAVLLLFVATLSIFGYRQFSRDVSLTAAYPSTPVTPNRQLSFQGRLENAGGTPITVATNFVFKLFTASTLGTELYSSGTCSITPDSDGVFSTQIGSTCGAGIPSSVFSENSNVWLEVTVGTETLTPRQQIATVAYALNSETLQGFPISSTVSAIRNTVVPMNQWGEIIIGEQNPRMTGVSGTYTISAPSLSLTTTSGSNGNITLDPDGTGQVNVVGATTSTNFFNVTGPALTTGSLITGTVANANTGYKLIDLLSGSSPTSKFSVSDAGNTVIAGTITLPNSNVLTGVSGYTQFSGGVAVGGGTTYYLNTTGDLNANTGTFAGTLTANGNVQLGNATTDTIDFQGRVLANADIIPITATGNNDLGTSLLPWDDIYAVTLHQGANLVCDSSGANCPAGAANYWRLNLGTISPVNDTLDLLVGSNATTSAKFAVLNVNSGTPTASISGTTANVATFLDGNGNLSTTNRTNLTLGNSATYNSTANILLNPNGTGSVGIGTTTPDAKLESLATSGEQLRLSYSDGAEYAGFTVNSTGDLTITPQGNLTVTTDGTGNGEVVLPNDAIGPNEVLSTGQTDEYCLTYESTGGTWEWQTCGSGGSSNWRINLGTLSPNNDTLDVLVGGNTTASAKAAFLNINSGTPTASVSAGAAGAAYLTATGTLATTAKQTLTIGGTDTGNVVIAPGGVTALTAVGANLTAAGNLTLTSSNNLIFGTTALGESTSAVDSGAYVTGVFDEFDNSASITVQGVLNDLDASLTTALTGAALWTDGGTYLYPTSAETLGNSASAGANKLAGIYLADSAPLTFGTDNDFSFAFNNTTSTLGSTLAAGTRLGINTTSALATLDVRSSLGTIPVASFSGSTSMATVIVDQSGSGDIFTASSSGATRFVVKSNGNVGIGVSNPTTMLQIGGASPTISNTSGDLTIDSFGGSIVFSTADDLMPTATLNADIGSSGTPWEDIYGSVLHQGANLVCDSSGANCPSSSSNWTLNTTDGTLYPKMSTVDLFVGGTSSASAKFKVLNMVGSGTPTASISGTTANVATFLDGNGNLSTTNRTNLTLGNSATYNSTANILLNPNGTGNVGIGVTSPTTKLEVSGTASVSGNLIVGQGGYLGPQYGPLSLAYKSGANTWATGILIRDTTGNVEMQAFYDTANTAYFLDPAATGTSLSIDGNIVGNGAFYLSTGADATAVSIGTTGAGKLDAGTIDPPYTINGEKFATYMSSMTGVKEETTGTIRATEYVAGQGYRATLDFANALSGSDLWLFSKTSNLKENLDKLVVLLSTSSNTKTWYDIDPHGGKMYLYSNSPTIISYRLTAPRFDSENWQNTRDSESTGFVINEDGWSVSDAMAAIINEGKNQISTLFGNVETNLISPLSPGSSITVAAPVVIAPPQTSDTPALVVEGDVVVEGSVDASTISARVAQLTEIQAENITARNIVADTIEANHIIGLDAKIATLSSSMTETEITSLTDRIKARIALLSVDAPTASDVPAPEEGSSTNIIIDDTTTNDISTSIASSSATLTSLESDFVTINNYLAVIGQATITSLKVTDIIDASTIQSSNESKTLSLQPIGGTINMASGTLIVDSVGKVAINGDLLVSGKVLAGSIQSGTLALGNAPESTPSSELGRLLSIYNEAGEAVATIDASGSANLASVTTKLISITSGPDSTPSSALANTIANNSTAGQSKIISPNSDLTIESPYITKDSLVYLTPTTNTDNQVLFVKSKNTCENQEPSCVPSFTVSVGLPALSDISFNWWIIEVKQ